MSASAPQVVVRRVSTTVSATVTCDRCGQLDPGTDSTARRHARANPDHEVHMTRAVQIDYFTRTEAPDA